MVAAELGGLGRLPRMPGTWGSLGALGLYGLLFHLFGPGRAFGLLVFAVVLVSFPLCAEAERQLQTTDPPQVVWDEFAGLGLALIPLMLWPGNAGFPWTGFALLFGLFRLFDVLKPPPIRWVEGRFGGWSVTLDDLIAGVYSQAVFLLASGLGWVP